MWCAVFAVRIPDIPPPPPPRHSLPTSSLGCDRLLLETFLTPSRLGSAPTRGAKAIVAGENALIFILLGLIHADHEVKSLEEVSDNSAIVSQEVGPSMFFMLYLVNEDDPNRVAFVLSPSLLQIES